MGLEPEMKGKPEYAVEVQNLIKKFGSFVSVNDLSFAIRQGEIFGLLGPNGSGKTTTINMISGLSDPSSGNIAVFGYDPRKQSSEVRRLLGVVPQETALYEELTAERNLAFHAELFGYSGQEKKIRVRRMLELVELQDRAKSRAGTFSGGMKRRLAIARAMLHDPKLLYLDEPTLGVDVQSRNAIWEYIRGLKKEGRSVLITTNYLEEANALCDRIAIIDRGKLIALDSPQALKSAYGTRVMELELDKEPSDETVARIGGLQGVESPSVQERVMTVALNKEAELDAGVVMPQILQILAEAGLRVVHMNLREPSMDEVFLSLTGKGLRE